MDIKRRVHSNQFGKVVMKGRRFFHMLKTREVHLGDWGCSRTVMPSSGFRAEPGLDKSKSQSCMFTYLCFTFFCSLTWVVRVLRVANLFQEVLVTQFLGNYLLAVHLFFTKKLPQGPGKGPYNPWTVVQILYWKVFGWLW